MRKGGEGVETAALLGLSCGSARQGVYCSTGQLYKHQSAHAFFNIKDRVVPFETKEHALALRNSVKY